MVDNFKDINFPETLKISSSGSMMPLEFFGKVFPICNKIQFKLGYFSSNSICTLSYGFAQFIYNGGKIDFLINNFVSDEDYNLINNSIVLLPDFYERLENQILKDLEKLNDILTRRQVDHFYNCLRYLIDKNQINIVPVTTCNGEISHYKEALFWDKYDNIINIVGSCNFTYKGIVCNGESFVLNRSWGSSSEVANIKNELREYEVIFDKKSKDFIYLSTKALINVVHSKSVSKDIKELLDNEINLLDISVENNDKTEELKFKNITKILKGDFEKQVEKLISTPRFPGGHEPRDYQVKAYENWQKNNFSGIFGMATGTGKTKTSLNCLLNEYKKSNTYNAIILVPSIALLEQWKDEIEEFNFQNYLLVGGGNNWERTMSNFVSNYVAGLKGSLIIISTYASFTSNKFRKYFSKIESDFTLIADEAHNMGANNIKKAIVESKIIKKIGLSATPKRVYDTEGTQFINDFFNDNEPYTFSFSMEEAMKRGYLTDYKYYPVIVELNDKELEDYIIISKRLLQHFDFEKGEFKKNPVSEKLLLQRKNIIHKANNKLDTFKYILLELKKINKLKYIFTYVPEGYIYEEDQNAKRMLDQFIEVGAKTIPSLKMNSYLADDQNLSDLLRGFSEGRIDMLFAMKMLDEGVDVPRAEIGIFASSTGNPRQFIQRRGRLLRIHKDKPIATIYDMVVIPKLNDNNIEIYRMERNLVKNELKRVGYFASLSLNFYDTKNALENVCKKYDLDLDTIINEL